MKWIASPDDEQTNDIEFVPAWLDDTKEKYGQLLFLAFGDFDDDDNTTGEIEDYYHFATTSSLRAINSGEKEKKAEYYDRIYIGWYDGSNFFQDTKLPHPQVEDVVIADDWSNFAFAHFSLRLNDNRNRRSSIAPKIDPKIKYSFSFLADQIPDVRAEFFIRGKKYICEKLTATFSENGMSQLIKGNFYQIVE